MLTRHDLRWIYKVFKLASILNIYPVTFDSVTDQMKIQESKPRKFISYAWLAVLFCHFIYTGVGTIRAAFFTENSYTDFVPVMICFTYGFFSVVTSTHLMFFQRVQENVVVYNEILRIRGKKEFSSFGNTKWRIN